MIPAIPRLLKWTATVVVSFLLIMSLFRLGFHLAYGPGGKGFPGDAFLMGLRLDLRVVCILGVVMLLLSAFPSVDPFRREKARKFWAVLLSVLLLTLLFFYLVDFFHYDYLHQRLNASVLNYLEDAGISLSMVWQTYPVVRGTFAIIILVALGYLLFGRLTRRFQQMPAHREKKSWFWIFPFLVLMGLGIWGTVSQFAIRWSDVFTLRDAYRAQLALNPVQSFFSTLSFRKSTYDEKKVREGYDLMVDYLGLDPKKGDSLDFSRMVYPTGPIAREARPNIVLVICESFSAYKSSMWGNPLNPTPYFDSLSKTGVFFDRCFTPSYGTARGIWATLTGTPDVEFPKTSSRNPALIDQHTIINAFDEYQKYYFIGGSASWANIRGVLNFNIKGLKLYEQDDYNAEKVDVWGISDKNVFLNANKILSEEQKPFFAVIQTADNHRPYTIPEEDRASFQLVKLPEDTLKKYGYGSNEELNAFRYTDYCFRQYLEAAQKQAYFRNTVFVFIGDHGIRGNAGNMFPQAWSEQALTSYHVPLLFYSPLLQAQRRTGVCSQIDVLPSIAGLVSRPYLNTTLGKNLFDPAVINDPFRASSAFIIDPDEKKLGMLWGDYYFRKNIGKGGEEVVSLVNNDPVPAGPLTDSLIRKLGAYTEAFYQTSRYVLYHNKKP